MDVNIPPPVDYPAAYLTCKICGAARGLPCFTRSGMIVEGQPDRAGVTIDRPHIARKRSARFPAAT